MSEKELIEKAEVISAIRDYESIKTQRRERKIDYTVTPSESDDRVLIRVIIEPKSKSGYVSVDTVRNMSESLRRRKFDKGILIAKRFTEAAKREMGRNNIEAISERIMPYFKLETLYLTINSCVDGLCKTKCDRVPVKKSDCKGYVDGHYSCDVRVISDNSSFHFERGWTEFLKRDLARLLTIKKAMNG